jgi:hypothetical protein
VGGECYEFVSKIRRTVVDSHSLVI